MVGATGGMGAAITEELAKQSIPTILIGRFLQKLEQLRIKIGKPEHVTIVTGDAFCQTDIVNAAEDADVLFQLLLPSTFTFALFNGIFACYTVHT
ncbi:NAD(P)H-binding protein [Bacillus cereus]|uniref:NAD(P)H-binding protein n=1 Tax=Bacillus cereus TaxID=1396 RepID=UPI000950FECB|nr:NAD(P)H-binding protein [Bacillus cereus]OLR27483.1 hypothetical protein BLD50_01500 [Bacillus cereus]